MAFNTKDISTGHDCTLQLNGPNGIIAFTRLTMFDVKVEYYAPESGALDGITRRQSDIKSYTVSIEFERVNNFLDMFLAAKQANFLIDGTEQYLSATETIRERTSNNINQYIYQNCDLQITDMGDRKLGDFIKIKGNFFASTRLPSPSNSAQ